MQFALCIAGVLCLVVNMSTAQQPTVMPPWETEVSSSSQPAEDILRTTFNSRGGPAGGPALAWHNYRQHRSVGDIAPGVVLTWDIPLLTPLENMFLTFRPGVSYLHPSLLIDAALRLKYRDIAAVIAGFSFDPMDEREFRFEDDTPEWAWINEHDVLGKRSFALLGIQIPTRFAYYEFLYRIQLEKGAHAYWINPETAERSPAGYRRYFLLSAGLGIWL